MFHTRTRVKALAVMVVTLFAISTAPTRADGQASAPSRIARAQAPAHRNRLHAPMSADLRARIEARLTRAPGRVTVFVELAKTSAADASAAASPSGKSASRQAAANAKRDTDTTANSVVAELKSKDPASREVSRTKNAVSGVFVNGSSDAIKTLAARADVVNITPVVPKKADNAHSAALTKVLQTWQDTGTLGDGVRVGIIDTGVDYTHADFGGPGTTEAFDGVNRTGSTPLFPNAKVVGGVDLAGEIYDSESDDPAEFVPSPDGNPLDCDGHGTHVAGTAAGLGVNADGSTFIGDYTALDESSLFDMRIGPGMAPHASLYAIKVFGCPEQGGSTDLVGPAIDWALDPNQDNDFSDHLDIVNISIGTDFGAPDDPENAFVRNAAKHGMLAVISAGNGDDVYDVGGSPGDAPEALTVASSRGSSSLDAVEVTAPGDVAGTTPGQYSLAFDYDGFDKTRAVVKMTDSGNTDGCDAFSETDAANVAGKYVWLEWDDNDSTRRCVSETRTDNATAAGAEGVVLTSTLEPFVSGKTGNDAIPLFQLTATATDKLRPAVDAGTLVVRMAGDLREAFGLDETVEDLPSSFTSRGTRSPGVKPDVAAPGDGIVSAGFGTGNDQAIFSGTSMASPHVAGIAALVKAAHPTWTSAELKATVMNTAGHDVFSEKNQSGPIEAPNRVGAGRVDALAAVDNQVIAFDNDLPNTVSIGFGVVEVSKNLSLSKTINVVNKGSGTATYSVAYQPITNMPGVSYSLNKSTVTIPGNSSTKIKVTVAFNRDALRKKIDPTVAPLNRNAGGNDFPRQFVADASGRVVLTPTAGATVALRVPVYAAPKPTGALTEPAKIGVTNNEGSLNVSGRALDQGTGSEQFLSLYSVMELAATSPRMAKCAHGRTTDCTINGTAQGGDISHVGVMSTAPAAKGANTPEDSLMAFGIATWSNWYNLGNNTIPFVDIYVDGDNEPDFETYAWREPDTDLLWARTDDLHTGDNVDLEPINTLFGDVDTNVYDSNVIVLPVFLDALGIDPTSASHRIAYFVGIDGFYEPPSDPLVDWIPQTLSFDPLKPGLRAEGNEPSVMWIGEPGTSLDIFRKPGTLAEDHSDSLLVFNFQNGSGSRASVVKVTTNSHGHV